MNAQEIEKFIKDGWVIIDIPQPALIHEYAAGLEKKAREVTGTDCSLAKLHEYVTEEEFKAFHAAMAEYFWASEFSIHSRDAFLPVLKDLIGLDIMVQYMPYLRFARPQRPEDNIGYHKDTQYGQTPYELAVHIPFVDLDGDSALKVISGSHRHPESHYPVKERSDYDSVKGSIEHRLGRPYASRQLFVPEGVKPEPLAMRVGQAALFSPAIFHGQDVNRGSVTRVTTDLRYVNTNAKTTIKTGKTHAGYVPLALSPIEETAQEYYQAQQMTA